MALTLAGATLIGAGLNLGGSILGTGMSYRKSAQLAQLQNQLNVEQWHRENAYNTPLSQMNRLREAGLNPQLAAGGPNLAASSPTLTGGQMPDINIPDLGKSVMDYIQAKQIDQEMKMRDGQIEGIGLDNQIKQITRDYKREEYESLSQGGYWDAKVANAKLKNDYQASLIRNVDTMVTERNMNIEKIATQLQINRATVADIYDRIDFRKLQRELVKAQINNYEDLENYRSALRAQIAAQIGLTEVNTDLAQNTLGLSRIGLGGNDAASGAVRAVSSIAWQIADGIVGLIKGRNVRSLGTAANEHVD